jgi:transposase InsO family protein
MPWPTTDVNTIRREFVTQALLRGASFAALCRQYGISRKTGYKWRQRALADGLNRLAERSRRPLSCPHQLDEATVCTLLRLKLRHPSWGPKKICQLYGRQFQPVPSLSSCQRVLTRAGLVLHRRRQRQGAAARISLGAVARAPNEVWTVDFKGWWRTADGQRCEPLTVRDAFSRFVLAVRTLPKADAASVRAEFERLFQTYGLPQVIKSDNGAPFAMSTAPLGLSRLSAWWVALGIDLDRSRPAHPQDNGAHERLHRDIAVELSHHVQADLASQQAAFDLWREEFNWQRPHEALGGRSPGQVYQKSPRGLPVEPLVLDYGVGFFPRKITPSGTLKWKRQAFCVSTALVGRHVGLRYVDHDHLEVWFNHLFLGHLELSSARFLRAASRPQEALSLPA